MTVPKDFVDGELVWTLTSNGRTEKAFATLAPDYATEADPDSCRQRRSEGSG